MNQTTRNITILSIGQSLCSCVANIIHQCIPPIAKAAFNASIAGYIMSLCHSVTVLTAPIAAYVTHRIGIINTMRVYCLWFTLGAIIWLVAKNPLWALIPMCLTIYTGHGFKMLEAYVTHTSDKGSGGKNFGIFQAIAGVGIFGATMIYPVIKGIVYPIVPLMTIAAMIILFVCTFFVPQDTLHHQNHPRKSINQVYAALFETIKKGWHFVKTNHYYPIFYISYSFFRGFVYTALLFLIPLHLMEVKSGNFIDGLPIGIYELLVIFFGGICGYFADKVDRKKYNILGWGLIVLGFLAMIWRNNTTGLIILGFITGMGRNIMYAASTHILEEKDIDHKEDTDFTALERSILKIGSVIAPLLLGPIYQRGGFHMSIIVVSGCMAMVGIAMIIVTIQFKR